MKIGKAFAQLCVPKISNAKESQRLTQRSAISNFERLVFSVIDALGEGIVVFDGREVVG